MKNKRPTLVDRLDARITTSPGCWEWRGDTTASGYGRIWVKDRHILVHRVVFELLVGSIPNGLVLDHLCRNKVCVNPDHLEPVTNRVNILRGIGPSAQHAQATACPHGHPYDATNTLWWGRARRYRVCARCMWARGRRSQPYVNIASTT